MAVSTLKNLVVAKRYKSLSGLLRDYRRYVQRCRLAVRPSVRLADHQIRVAQENARQRKLTPNNGASLRTFPAMSADSCLG